MTGTSLAALRALTCVKSIVGDERVHVSGVFSDSRRVQPGAMFAAISGTTTDGGRYIDAALDAGASSVLASRVSTSRVPTVLVDDVRKALGPVAQLVYGQPTHALLTVGITGTNGKTTVSYLVDAILREAGHEPALIGTVSLRGPKGEIPAELTTPEADAIARFAAEQQAAGATHLIMEVSSHALDQARVFGVRFETAAFTNLTQDHLDFHGTMEAYGAAKALLFTEYQPRSAVICVDSPFGHELARKAKSRVLRCSTREDEKAELRATRFTSSRAGIAADVATPAGPLSLSSPLFGAHNLENLLVSVGVGLTLGVSLEVMQRALAMAQGAPGRMERVENDRDVLVLVDYAHTPDALERALSALRPLTQGRLFVIAGCGGDRDRLKRAPMGRAALRGSDIALLTSDNPRTEAPEAILDDMTEGLDTLGVLRLAPDALRGAQRGYTVIVDRQQAIECAIDAALPGDTILLAGKGHETYQIIGKTKHRFDDREQARRLLQARGDG